MDPDPITDKPDIDELQHLKRVSRVKHKILARYLPPWVRILGSTNSLLAYVDCFAGPGQYEMEGQPVEGSPVIAVKEAVGLTQRNNVRRLILYLVDEDPKQVEKLKAHLKNLQPYPPTLKVEVAWELPFIPKYYRAVVKQMEGNEVTIQRITSKRDGVSGEDRVRFK